MTVAALLATFALQAGAAAPSQPAGPVRLGPAAPPTQPTPADSPAERADTAAKADPLPSAPRMDFGSAVRAGAEALAGKDHEAAIAAYEAALADRPDSAEAAYNLGIALYRAGRFQDAEKMFARSGAGASNGPKGDAGLAASSLFNRAASFYGATRPQAEAAQRMLEKGPQGEPGAAAPTPVDPKALEQAIKDAKESFKGFKDAAYAAPEDVGARANAEQSMRLVRALEELRKQQQQQQQQEQEQQQQDQQKQEQQKQEQKEQDQQQRSDQQQQQDGQDAQQRPPDQQAPPKDEPKQDAGAGTEQPKEDQGKSEEPPKKDQQQPGQQDRPDQPKDQGSKEESQPKEPPRDGQAAPKDGEMTKEQADRLLQAVRDRERERRTAQERKAETARGRPPAKDW